MTIRFAPARHSNPFTAVVVRNSGEARVWNPANDNGPVAANDEALLADTLRHFGTHGLRAAQTAAQSALAARALGDETGFAHWRAVCRMLDSRLAKTLCGKSIGSD